MYDMQYETCASYALHSALPYTAYPDGQIHTNISNPGWTYPYECIHPGWTDPGLSHAVEPAQVVLKIWKTVFRCRLCIQNDLGLFADLRQVSFRYN